MENERVLVRRPRYLVQSTLCANLIHLVIIPSSHTLHCRFSGRYIGPESILVAGPEQGIESQTMPTPKANAAEAVAP